MRGTLGLGIQPVSPVMSSVSKGESKQFTLHKPLAFVYVCALAYIMCTHTWTCIHMHIPSIHTHNEETKKFKCSPVFCSLGRYKVSELLNIKFQLPDISSESSKQTVTTWRELSDHKRLCQMKHGTSSGCDFWELADANHWKTKLSAKC